MNGGGVTTFPTHRSWIINGINAVHPSETKNNTRDFIIGANAYVQIGTYTNTVEPPFKVCLGDKPFVP
jgi:hypothetical protein